MAFESIAPSSIIASTNLSAPASGFAGGDVSEATVLAVAELMATGAETATPAAGGTLTINSVALESYDYKIHDGNLTITDTADMADYFTATEDTRSAWLIVKGNLTVNESALLRPQVRKLFACIYATGTATINGSVSMTARGANHNGTGNSGFGSAFTPSGPLLIASGDWDDGVGTVSAPEIPVAGGAGGAKGPGSGTNGAAGDAGTAGGSGGGGSGGRSNNFTGEESDASGAAGSMFAGGPAGGGTYYGTPTTIGTGLGGAGGPAAGSASSSSRAAGGGAGNPGGAGAVSGAADTFAEDGETGCAGLLIVIADILAGSGSATSDGGKGGNSDAVASASTRSASGGGSGGGHVTTLAKTSDTSTITVQANGGAAGVATSDGSTPRQGGAGGLGSARILEPAA